MNIPFDLNLNNQIEDSEIEVNKIHAKKSSYGNSLKTKVEQYNTPSKDIEVKMDFE